MPALLGFFVRRVLAAAVAELRELETAGGRLLVLRRRVIPLLAYGALQRHNFAHLFILTDRPESRPGRSKAQFHLAAFAPEGAIAWTASPTAKSR
jgi:hypothetical protein